MHVVTLIERNHYYVAERPVGGVEDEVDDLDGGVDDAELVDGLAECSGEERVVQLDDDSLATLGVVNAANNAAFTKVASGPVAGQYSYAAGVYTFASADNVSGISVIIALSAASVAKRSSSRRTAISA